MQRNRKIPILFALFATVGCGGEVGGQREVSGSVSYDGQPVEVGQIIFEPEAPGLKMATGQIEAGQYRIQPEYGPVAGTYRVRIEAYRKVKAPNLPPHPYLGDDQEQGVTAKQYLPLAYNARTTLQVEISGEGENVHNFDLKAKPGN